MPLGRLANLHQKAALEKHRLRLLQLLRRRLQPFIFIRLRQPTPLSRNYGYTRGTPVDRYYIECFLSQHQTDIHGRVLEVKDRVYTERFGMGVEHSEILDIDPSNPRATLVMDLTSASNAALDTFNCIIVTQTLQLIYDTPAAVATAYQLLASGGVLLATVPSVSRIMPGDGIKTDYWRFTVASCTRLFGDVFGNNNVSAVSFGSVVTNIAFLTGLAREELSARQLDSHDDYFPLIIGVRAVKQ